MPSWEIYRISAELSRREAARAETPPFRPSPESWDHVFTQLLLNPEIGLVNRVSIDLEYRWWKAKRPVYFVEDQSLVRKIYNLGLDVRLEELVPPEPVMALSFPSGTVVEGKKLEPCLFGCVHHRAGEDPRTHPLSVFYNTKPGNEHIRISALIRDKDRGHEGRQNICSVTDDGDFQTLILHDSVPDRAVDITDPYQTPLADEKRRTVALHLRLCVGFCLYLRVFPEAVREGWPKGVRVRDIRHWSNAGVGIGKTFLTVPRLRGEVSPHLRRGHFRHLRDPRFKRNPDGSVRVIYIDETVVARDRFDPHTVEEIQDK